MVENQAEVKPETNNVQEKIDVTKNEKPVEQALESDKEINWRKFKEAREQERKHSEEMSKKASEKEAEAQALKAALDAVLNKPNQNQQQYSNTGFEEPEESEDARIEKKVLAAIAKRDEAVERQRKERETQEYPTKLRNDMRDFDDVCNASNLDYLDYHYPEVSKPFAYMPDGYEKWAAVYKAVKRFIPNTNTKKDEAKMQNNLNKPQASNSSLTNKGENILPNAKALEATRAANYARMQKTIKGLSN